MEGERERERELLKKQCVERPCLFHQALTSADPNRCSPGFLDVHLFVYNKVHKSFRHCCFHFTIFQTYLCVSDSLLKYCLSIYKYAIIPQLVCTQVCFKLSPLQVELFE